MSIGFIEPDPPMGPSLSPPAGHDLSLRALGMGGVYEGDTPIEAGCLRCSDTPCATYSLDERGGDETVPAGVCPTDAIVPSPLGMTVDESCVGCGLCIARCSYGAIRQGDDGLAEVQSSDTGYAVSPEDEASSVRAAIVVNRSWSDRSTDRYLRLALHRLGSLGQYPFYEFVASLLTALGVPTRAGRHGDTSLRMDAVAPHPVDSVPIEIKSPLESPAADLKAVRQALENFVVMRARQTDPTSEDAVSLAIGFEPVAARSDAAELATDIQRTYGVPIRVYSVKWLLNGLADLVMGEGEFEAHAFRSGELQE